MSTTNQLNGGSFQDSLGNVLVKGYLILELSQDAQVNGNTQLVAGYTVKILLDGNGNVTASPAQYVWPNDVMSPSSTFYIVSAYTANGQLVWGPNSQQVLSSPSPFNVGSWVPATVNTLPPTNVTLTGIAIASSATSGSDTLPSNPVGFLPITVNGTAYKIALYNV